MRALEAGMHVPLHGFFCEALAHFGIAPAQLTPNGWRVMTGFLGLCHSSGVPPSLAVFRYFFALSIVSKRQRKGWYYFRSRDSSGLLFTGLPNPNSISIKYWKHEFFFLSSPEPWPCPVEWGEPPNGSSRNLVLAGEEKKSAAKLLRAHGGAAVDVRPYLSNRNLAAATITTAFALPPPPPAPSSYISCPQGMDPAVYAMMKTMLAEKAAAQASASAKKVNAELDSKAAGSPPLCGKKRSLEEANDRERPSPTLLNTAIPSGVCSPPPGFPSWHDRDGTNRVATREQLEEAKREAKPEPEQEKSKADLAGAGAELAKANAGIAAAEAEVVKANAGIAAAKQAADAEQENLSFELAMEAANAKAKLAVAKRALAEELQRAKTAAVRQLLCCEDHVRRRAEHALERYRRWRTGRAPAGPAA
uniref:Uncharacterized protein n=1 Tax=Avena sativa TaxID=4498 RepID=A0ACD6AE66_AVESA